MNDVSTQPGTRNLRCRSRADGSARRRAIAFLNFAHAIDHFVLLIFPAIVIGLQVVYQRPYAELIALSTAAFVAFGVFSIPAGWLADRWSRRNMMAVFYFGCGVSLIGAGLAPSPTSLAIAMFFIGTFAAIYHPVGMAMLIDVSQMRPRTLAFNGVCGNLGVTLAAGISTTLAAWIDWRAAFLVPAVICLATGVAYLALVADDSHHIGKRKTIADVVLSPRAAIVMFACYIAISLAGGLTFNTALIALPKLIDERVGDGIPLVVVGWLATGIFLCGALAQLTMGRLLERVPSHFLFAAVATVQFASLLWTWHASGAALIVSLAVAVGAIYAQVDGRRHRDRALYRRCVAWPGLCGALFPHLHFVRHRGPADRPTLRPRRLRPRARCNRTYRLHHDGRRLRHGGGRQRRRDGASPRGNAGGIETAAVARMKRSAIREGLCDLHGSPGFRCASSGLQFHRAAL